MKGRRFRCRVIRVGAGSSIGSCRTRTIGSLMTFAIRLLRVNAQVSRLLSFMADFAWREVMRYGCTENASIYVV